MQEMKRKSNMNDAVARASVVQKKSFHCSWDLLLSWAIEVVTSETL